MVKLNYFKVMFAEYNKQEETEQKEKIVGDIMKNFPTDDEIFAWLKKEKCVLCNRDDIPKLLKSFTKYILNNK